MGVTITGGVGISSGISITEGAAGDPYFSNVVLLLHGDGTNGGTTFTDSSSYARTPATTQNITTSSDYTLFGQNTIKSLGGTEGSLSKLQYASSLDFTRSNTYTLEFWVYYPTSMTDGYLMARGPTSYLQTYSNDGGTTWRIDMVNWGAGGGTTPTVSGMAKNTWHYVVFTQEGSRYNSYLNGVRFTNANDGTTASPSSESLGITNVPTRNDLKGFFGYLSEVRYTQGVSRYSGATIPVQSAPWPNS